MPHTEIPEVDGVRNCNCTDKWSLFIENGAYVSHCLHTGQITSDNPNMRIFCFDS